MPAVIYVVAMYLVWALSVEDGFAKLLESTILTVVIVIAGQLFLLGIKRTVRRVFYLKPEVKTRYPGLEARANRYQPILMKICTIIVGIIFVKLLDTGNNIVPATSQNIAISKKE